MTCTSTFDAAEYRAFLEAKRPIARIYGEPIDAAAVHPRCKPHQAAIIRWAVQGGRRAIFADFGLGKSGMQIEAVRLTQQRVGGVGLIIAPLTIARLEFPAEARELGIDLQFVRTTAEITGPGLYVTNYESVREGKIDVRGISVVSLDEASILRGMGGTKTFREFMRLFDRTPHRFVATATPSPNDYIELLGYAAFLGIMDIGEAKTRFFKRNSEKADELTIHPHKEAEFWLWVNSWAVVITRPSDLGFPDDGYELPPLDVRYIEVLGGETDAGEEKDGQRRLLSNAGLGVQQAAAEKRGTIDVRIAKVRELILERPAEHVVIWHDLESERSAIEQCISGYRIPSVYGSQDLDERETIIGDFAYGRIARLAAKPVMLGSGCNLQRFCAWAIFAGVSHKFHDFIQAIHRIHRFLQTRTVRIDVLYAASENEVVRNLQAKWKRHDAMVERLRQLIKQYGLNAIAAQEALARSIGVERREAKGESFHVVHNDTVIETAAMPDNSVGLIVTSIPFGTQYEYTPSYNDFGHTDDDAHFWRQMEFLTPELARVLQPGRMMCVHVKDRVRPGGLDGIGFQTVSPFAADAIQHFHRRCGLWYMGQITVTTDVVRENNQTYRLGYTQKCRFRDWTAATVYDHSQVIDITRTLEAAKRLPPGFMLCQPASWHPQVWTDVTRMRTLNGAQHAAGREMHVCPLQFDIVDRLIKLFSMPGEVVFDPFGGIMTVVDRAIALGRYGKANELSGLYFDDGLRYCRATEEKRHAPTLFELSAEEAVA